MIRSSTNIYCSFYKFYKFFYISTLRRKNSSIPKLGGSWDCYQMPAVGNCKVTMKFAKSQLRKRHTCKQKTCVIQLDR